MLLIIAAHKHMRTNLTSRFNLKVEDFESFTANLRYTPGLCCYSTLDLSVSLTPSR
jgi:hypothetical protein